MKNLLTYVLSLMTLLLTLTPAFSHTGHLANDSVHGLLHVEHIVVLVTLAAAVYLVKLLGKK